MRPHRPATILIVDDEPEVVEVLAEVFADAGYQVETAPDARVALERIAGSAPDVIVSDVTMPGMSGPEFYAEIERRSPALCRRFVLVAGDVESEAVRDFVAQTGVSLLAKPFDFADALRVVRRLVEPVTGTGSTGAGAA